MDGGANACISKPSHRKNSGVKKPGRPRKYEGGWLSVQNHFVKQIKLHTKVYIRWCRLKGEKQHSQFASVLLDLYESVNTTTKAFNVAQQCCIINPVEVVSTTDLQPRINMSHKLEGGLKRNVVPISVDCYEDTQYKTTPTVHSGNTRAIKKQQNKKLKMIANDSVKITDLTSVGSSKTATPSSNTEGEEKSLNITASNSCGGELSVVIPVECSKEIPSGYYSRSCNLLHDSTAETNNPEEKRSVFESMNCTFVSDPVRVESQYLIVDNNLGISEKISERNTVDISPSPQVENDSSIFHTVSMDQGVFSSDITTSNVSNIPVNFLNNALKTTGTAQVAPKTMTDSAVAVNRTSENVLSVVASPIKYLAEHAVDTTCKNLKDVENFTLSKAASFSAPTVGADSAVGDLQCSELAVAKIISSLSDSLKKKGSGGSCSVDEGCTKKDAYRTRTPAKRSGCKNETKTGRVRHMATQFTTQVLNIKRYRTVSTQTVFQTFMVSKQTETEHELFCRSIQTQYWPSPLWTKFINQHPEIIYNINLNEQPEFPEHFRLYRKRGKLHSTLFGSQFEVQRKPGMRCISVAEFGGPEVLRLLSSIPTPKPVGKQVLVNVKAAGVNPVDTYIRSGTYASSPKLPYTPGKDGAGIIQQIGDKVTKIKKGDRVWFYGSMTGSYAEYCVVDEENVGMLPIQFTFEEGAMIGVPYLTAYRALFQKERLQPGETVFIHGASGGVGTAAVQMCKSFGARVIGTAGSAEGISLLNNMGVDAVYNHRESGYLEEVKKNETQIDLILEMLANVNLDNDLQLVRRLTGRIVIIGSRGPVEINPRSIMTNEATVTGIVLLNSSPDERAEQMHYINEGMKNGWVKPILWKVMELENAKEVHREIIESKGARGQIVLKINPSLSTPEYGPIEL